MLIQKKKGTKSRRAEFREKKSNPAFLTGGEEIKQKDNTCKYCEGLIR